MRYARFFVLRHTARQAPAWAKTAGAKNARIVSDPKATILLIAMGTSAQWKPKSTMSWMSPPRVAPASTGLREWTQP